ncbi:MAG: hypothetical protein MJ219_03155 [Mycoplasmoidaceae bacterium]|nr:hypothetical protein [Mycoplasmoidaceae bacterium]
MTTRKLKTILIPCLSGAVAVALITPAIVLTRGAKIKIEYADYREVKTVGENFDLPFILMNELEPNQTLKLDFKTTFADEGISNIRTTSDLVIDNKNVTQSMAINIDWSKIREGEGNFFNLACTFTCVNKNNPNKVY